MKRMCAFSLCLAFMIGTAGISGAHHPPTPRKLDGVRILSIEVARTIMYEEEVFIVDSRKSWNFAKGHIEHAVSLPFSWITFGDIPSRKGQFDMSKLPSDKDVKLIFYSDGIHNWDSYNSSKEARDAGYNNVMWIREGLKAWIEKGYPIEKE